MQRTQTQNPAPATAAMVEIEIRRVLDEVHRYAQFRLGQAEDAEDATMETWEALRARPAPFLACDDQRRYAIGVCRRKVANIMRKRRWSIFRREPSEDRCQEHDSRISVAAALRQLSDDQREVLALKYFHEFSAQEIAELMGRTPAAVNSLLQRARDAFARIYEEPK